MVHRYAKLSLPFLQEQLIFPTILTKKAAEKKAKKKAQKVAKRVSKQSGLAPVSAKQGRPKGSKNKPKTDVPSPEGEGIKTEAKEEIAYTFQVLETLLDRFLQFFKERLSAFIQIKYFVGNGGFGNNTVAKIVRSKGLHLISKLTFICQL